MPGDMRPVVGDWVVVHPYIPGNEAVIEGILPRKTTISRQVPGGRDRYSGGNTHEHVLAANVDTAFIVCSMDDERNMNLRRIERYLTIASTAGVSPVIVLNKLDLCNDVPAITNRIGQVALGVPTVAMSATNRLGLDKLGEYLLEGSTSVFLGSSGVGKSSIINALLGEERLRTRAVRDLDHRGRHTTTHRELVTLPQGGMVIDTPGMREIQVWGDEDDIGGTFQDIENLAQQCRFRDCSHDMEPGCAVQRAIVEGTIDSGRLRNYRKLRRETVHLAARQDGRVKVEERLKWKKISQWQKKSHKRVDRQA